MDSIVGATLDNHPRLFGQADPNLIVYLGYLVQVRLLHVWPDVLCLCNWAQKYYTQYLSPVSSTLKLVRSPAPRDDFRPLYTPEFFMDLIGLPYST
jgi:hypothetical protein